MNRSAVELLETRVLLSAISGTVYEDVDANGVKSGPDNTLGGWTVFLDIDQNGVLNDLPDGTSEPFTTTNSGGDYQLNSVAPGVYRLMEIVLPGWRPTAPAFQEITVTAGRDSKADFFNFAGGDITGTVWNDLDMDGVRAVDPISGEFTEPGLARWTVFLDLNTNRALDEGEPTSLTDDQGSYLFTDVPAGDYEVTEVLPAGWEVTKGFDTKQTATAEALTTVTQDFANFSLTNGSIRGTVWNDTNVDGIRQMDPDTGEFTEPGLADWTVFLDLNNNGTPDPTEPTTLTDADGNYAFVSLAAGDYEVTEVLPPGWDVSPGFDSRQTVAVFGGENSHADDFANFTVENGSIRGTVWNDLNRDGVRNRDFGGAFTDPGLAGWSVFLDLNDNGAFDASEPTAVTDAAGNYTFIDLQVGEYTLIEIVPTGWETSPTFDDNYSVRVYSGTESAAHDFANFNLSSTLRGSVSGFVFNDVNGNGLLEALPSAEPGLEGWSVFIDLNGNRLLDADELSATTGADGSYTISGVPAGTISLVEMPMAGWQATAPVSHVRSLVLKSGENVHGINFGNQQLKDSSILGTVFTDANKNGQRDPEEHGLAGITIYLDLNHNGLLDSDEPQSVTSEDQYYTPAIDEAGHYSFTHMATSTYTVRQVVPAELSSTPSTEFEHTVTLSSAEKREGVNFADVFRPNEIHGVKFDDKNGNHVRDLGEDGVAGTTIYLDLNRNNQLDADEPTTITQDDGSYSFTGLTPGAYVVREMAEAGYDQTYPTTTGGTLWPEGTSNPPIGNVSPLGVSTSLAEGESYRQTVSLTLPNTGALTNAVDVFLLFDDTGSFVNNSPIVRAAFPDIITQLQASLSGVDLAFGVGRFEEYSNFAAEYSTGRPFVLNQPIVATSNPDYMAAIQSALDRTTPGYGGDQPETVIEALYQLVTGLGFDGNNNGSVLDSGAAGLASTQLTPGNSGDVPSFASFTADAANSVLSASGTIGGAGFRAGALPVILLATDTGFAYQPQGETTVTGINGATLPVSSLTQTSRSTTPFNSGAGLQETITGLNALGALVIGLGTNPQNTLDPRQGLEAISILTGATNQSAVTIANGTADAIAPGDPLYFQIASGFAGSVANGVINAIQNAVTNVAVNITVQASDPRVKIINHTGTLNGITSGQTAAFDIEFVGDGIPHRFDLQFVREGTNVVLGSIPVVIGTPIPGDGYHFDDLDEGEIELEDDFGDLVATAPLPNIAPSFTAGPNLLAAEDAGLQTITAWATDVSAGPVSEAGQLLDFIVTNDNPSLFAEQPAITSDGTLTFTAAANAFGSANITVMLHDNGGTANGGQDLSLPQQFTITVTAVNDAPIAYGETRSTDEDTALLIPVAELLANDFDIDGDPLTVKLESQPSHGTLASDSTGNLIYTPFTDFNGTDSFQYVANDGIADSSPVVVTINVNAMNDAPVAVDDSYSTDEDVALIVPALGVLSNDSDVDGDTLTAELVSGAANGDLILNADGSFTYTPRSNFHGVDSFTYHVTDGLLNSNTATVSLMVNALNDAPFAVDDSYSTDQDVALNVPSVGVLSNDSDVDGDALSAVFVSGPANGVLTLNADGSFTYTPQAGFSGTDSFTYTSSDGTATSRTATVSITMNPVEPPPPMGDLQFHVVDFSSRGVFNYDPTGTFVDRSSLNAENRKPRGIASNTEGRLFWVIDTKGDVFVYDNQNQLLGSWDMEHVDKPEGIAVSGRDLLVVDGRHHVSHFLGGAELRSGNAAPTERFTLDRENRRPTDLATDGSRIWVTDQAGSQGRIFVYTMDGRLQGSWILDPANSHPTGMAIAPDSSGNLWVVDSQADRVFLYEGARDRTTGGQLATSSLPLNTRDKNPQGLAISQIPGSTSGSASTPRAEFTHISFDATAIGQPPLSMRPKDELLVAKVDAENARKYRWESQDDNGLRTTLDVPNGADHGSRYAPLNHDSLEWTRSMLDSVFAEISSLLW